MVGELSMPAKCGIGHALWSCCWACTPIATNASRRSWAQLVGFAGLHVHDMAVMLSTKRLCGVYDMIHFYYASASGCRQRLILRSQRAVENAILINIVLAAHVYVGGRWPKCVGRLAAGRWRRDQHGREGSRPRPIGSLPHNHIRFLLFRGPQTRLRCSNNGDLADQHNVQSAWEAGTSKWDSTRVKI